MKLVNEAENALVPAGVLLVHEIGFKLQPQRFILPLSDGNGTLFPLRIPHRHRQTGIGLVKPVIQHIHDGVAVQGNKGLPCLDSGCIRRAVGVYLLDENCHGFAPFLWLQNQKRKK